MPIIKNGEGVKNEDSYNRSYRQSWKINYGGGFKKRIRCYGDSEKQIQTFKFER